MLNNSQDILNIVKAISIFAVAGVSTWAIYYLAMILRQIFRVSRNIGSIFEKTEEILDMIKDKVEHSVSYLLLISEGVKKLVEAIKDYSGKKSD
jgi:hypothetical protein